MPIDPSREQAVKRLKARRDFRSLAAIALLVTVVLNVVWAAGDRDRYWPMWAMIGLLVALLFAAYGAYGPRDDEVGDEEIEREVRRGER